MLAPRVLWSASPDSAACIFSMIEEAHIVPSWRFLVIPRAMDIDAGEAAIEATSVAGIALSRSTARAQLASPASLLRAAVDWPPAGDTSPSTHSADPGDERGVVHRRHLSLGVQLSSRDEGP